jgi:two-component system chemotaxis response regulator CheY
MFFLVVDDSITMRYLIRQNLTSIGIKEGDIVLCESGEEAIDFYRYHPECFILLDWHMKGISGLEVIRQIRTGPYPSTPVIMVTSEHKRRNIEDAIRAGTDDYIIKPIKPESLKKKIVSVSKKYNLGISNPVFEDA